MMRKDERLSIRLPSELKSQLADVAESVDDSATLSQAARLCLQLGAALTLLSGRAPSHENDAVVSSTAS